MESVGRARNQAVFKIVQSHLKAYMAGVRNRGCVWCNRRFKPKHRNHFLCSGGCRDKWYAGQLITKGGD